MTTPDEQLRFEANRAMWDERVPLHVGAKLYDGPSFRNGRGRWVLPEHRESVPLMYSIHARKPA